VRLRTIFGTAAALSLACVALATPAAAATTDLTVDAPEKVVVDSAYELVPWKLTGSATALADVNGMAFLQTVDGMDGLDFAPVITGRASGAFAVVARDVVPGQYVATAFASPTIDPDAEVMPDPYTVTDDTIVIKFGGRAGLTATRSGKVVTLTGSATRFSKDNKWIVTRPTIKFQRYINGAWSTIKTVTPDTKGHAVFKVTDATARSYRVYQSESTVAWSDYSSTVKK
jgi:hypothetical protein